MSLRVATISIWIRHFDREGLRQLHTAVDVRSQSVLLFTSQKLESDVEYRMNKMLIPIDLLFGHLMLFGKLMLSLFMFILNSTIAIGICTYLCYLVHYC